MSIAKKFLIDKGLIEPNFSKFTIKLSNDKEFVLNDLLDEYVDFRTKSEFKEENKQIIGYKLKDFVNRIDVDNLLGRGMPYFGDVLLSGKSKNAIDMTAEEKSVYFTTGHLGGSLVQRMKDLKLLDLWFEPIYKKD